MKKILIPVIAVACASVVVICSACQNSSESQPSAAPTSAPVIATADESTKDESATLPKITEPSATIPSSTSEVPTEPEQTEDGTVATYPNGMPVVAMPDDTTVIG